jgi:CRP-like cAMP-binding protein
MVYGDFLESVDHGWRIRKGRTCRSWDALAESYWRIIPAALIGGKIRVTMPRVERILELCEGMETVSFAAGDVLIPEGGKTGNLYILISGAVEVIKGENPITVIRDPGAFLGEISILLDQVHLASIEAVEATTCYVTGEGRKFLEDHPQIAVAVAELLALRLKGMIGYLADMKAQYEDRKDHLGMVDELLLNLAHRTPRRR